MEADSYRKKDDGRSGEKKNVKRDDSDDDRPLGKRRRHSKDEDDYRRRSRDEEDYRYRSRDENDSRYRRTHSREEDYRRSRDEEEYTSRHRKHSSRSKRVSESEESSDDESYEKLREILRTKIPARREGGFIHFD